MYRIVLLMYLTVNKILCLYLFWNLSFSNSGSSNKQISESQ